MTAPPGEGRHRSADFSLRSRPWFTLTRTLVTALAASLVATTAGVLHVEGRQAADGLSTVHGGQTCFGLPPLHTEVSCGTTAFGDLRYHCSSETAEYCPRTRAVTIRNSGTTPARLTVISGRSGHRSEQAPVTVRADHTAVLRAARGDYLYDIVLETLPAGPTTLVVQDVR
ncbi:hypothetical protein SAZ11_47675 [Streptomyces sp. FXJ1.4098]|uniref:hypothetical protein n=1 Tax=Streptomyces sp. NPDC020845 TaxID=3365096 RepID=UPI0029985421|nr:hypothetical protein [Streptomyces sp. FXJ1.4098]